ncbi:MAG: TerD family protein [Pseudomonadales bacterium]
MELVKGQSITLDGAARLIIDVGWRSLAADLQLQVHALYADNAGTRQLLHREGDVCDGGIERDAQGRRYCLNFDALAQMERLSLILMLPATSKYDFTQVQHLQAFVASEREKVATIKLNDVPDAATSMTLIEVYRHHNTWKLKLSAQQWQHTPQALAQQLGFELPAALNTGASAAVEVSLTDAEPAVEPPAELPSQVSPVEPVEQAGNLLSEGAKLSVGESFSLSDNLGHLQHLVWKVRTAPQLDDLVLSAVALNAQGRVRDFEDFIYDHNPTLGGGGFALDSEAGRTTAGRISLAQLPAEVDKLLLIVSRASRSKRLSSADFVQTKLESANTALPVCNFGCATVDKNYNCMILLEVYRHLAQWKVRAVGQGYAEGLEALAASYGFSAPRSVHRAETAVAVEQTAPSTEPEELVAPAQSVSATTGLGWSILAGVSSYLFIKAAMKPALIPMLISAAFVGAGLCLLLAARKRAKQALVEENERFMLQMIKRHNYQLTPFQVAAHCTLSAERARELLEMLCRSGAGQLIVREDGTEIYRFDELNNHSPQGDRW